MQIVLVLGRLARWLKILRNGLRTEVGPSFGVVGNNVVGNKTKLLIVLANFSLNRYLVSNSGCIPPEVGVLLVKDVTS